MAGMSAAEHFIRNGLKNIAIFEAKERLGSRILTNYSFAENAAIELGAQWIHGATVANNFYNLANIQRLIKDEKCTTSKGTFLLKGGKVVDDEFIESVKKQFGKINFEKANFSNVEQCFNQQFVKISSKFAESEKEVLSATFNVFKLSRMSFDGSKLNSALAGVEPYTNMPCDLDTIEGNDKFIK
ncbi:putative Protein anon-37Cs-like protein [Dinothrombium tinctorium]|uniref:Amine oxidase domain-containing protein n=1 Tax=Dinothrombium tinctorium TaxID=1965070 RepID=A0A3S3RHN0_9ACAR|nr:putative Protein anon-37Cs-like protein [Dinothrombium tinctorium]